MNKLIEKLVRPVDEDAEIKKEILRLTEVSAKDWMGPHDPAEWEPDPERLADVMGQVGSRFKDERVKGFTHPETGAVQAGVPAEQADQRWAAAEPKFRSALSKYDPEVQRRIRLFRRKGAGAAGGEWKSRAVAGAVCPHCGK